MLDRTKAKDIHGRAYDSVKWNELRNEALSAQAMVLLQPNEVPLCLTNMVSKTCWPFCTGTPRRRLTRSHSIVDALSMAICQWDSKSIVWATGANSLL